MNCFRESVYDFQDHCVTFRRGKSTVGTDGAGGDELFCVRGKRGPPKTLSDEGMCSQKSWMTSRFRRMTALEDLGPGSVRDKYPIR